MPKQAAPIEPKSVVGQNIHALIKESGLSVSGWAKKLEIQQTTINRILRDQLDPTFGTISKIAHAAHIQPWQLAAPDLGNGLVLSKDVHDLIVTDAEGNPHYIEVKATMAGDPSLTPDEVQDLVSATLDLPQSKAREILSQLMQDAEVYREYSRGVLKRFNATKILSNERAAEELPPPPAAPEPAPAKPTRQAMRQDKADNMGAVAKKPPTEKRKAS